MVSAAILEAAAELFAQRGPAATTIRDIAVEARVNHGLVFRHFGTKDRLVGAVLDHLADGLATLVASDAPSDAIDRAFERHTRVMARTLLDGYPAGTLQSSFPNLARLVADSASAFDDELDARLAIANVVAMQLGWRLFRPFLREGLRLVDVDDDAVAGSIAAGATALLHPR
ncbi:helix-turn-helix transcriptional regulator [Mycolicibacterium madagascariense]|nr:TetR/AcrR family transcriptional regulator [Mycolicibacterium madagascariense]MCV7012796.1 helix-turn-helix transcriptional regulator [Mycolicibacterium madagascariense]